MPSDAGARGLSAVAELVRLPAVLSVPGDALLGAAFARGGHGGRLEPADLRAAGALSAGSSLLYLGGMALNEYADREVDAHERPHRPIPSGRVTPRAALRLAAALTAAGVVVAGAAGGRRALATATALAATVWAYDLRLKDTPAGPLAMTACRVLDVLLGAAGSARVRPALPAAAVLGSHTLLITLVSRHEAQGASRGFARVTLWGTAAVTALAAGAVPAGGRRAGGIGRALLRPRAAAGLGLVGLYATTLLRAGGSAARAPTAANLQRFVGTGVLGFVPLQGALLATRAPLAVTAAVAAAWPLSRRLSRKRAVT